jgi:type 1 glutamine amidotransferase
LTDGEALTGVAVGGGEIEVAFADVTGKAIVIPKSRIASMRPSAVSLMPEGLLQNLSPQQEKDLLTFLLLPPPLSPAPLEIRGEPPARKREEFQALLPAPGAAAAVERKPLNIVLCAGPKDHGPGEHDYPLWQTRWTKLLGLAAGVTVETAHRWPSADQLASADVIVFYSNNPDWNSDRVPELDAFLKRGGGLVYIHYAVDGQKHCDELAERIGLAWRGGGSKFRHGPLKLDLRPHEITAGMSSVAFVDESYWQLVGSEKNIQLLASGVEEGKPQPLMWTRETNGGRVFVSIPGHYNWTFDDPLFRLLLLRGIAWTAREPLDRLVDLSTIGARVAD